jgi:hypothetical protein
MRVFERKQHQISTGEVIATEVEQNSKLGSLRDSLSDWLETVRPSIPATFSSPVARPRISIMSGLDFMRVSNATVREGESHCIWPYDVLVKLQQAEVITESSTSHYVVTDPHLRPAQATHRRSTILNL